MEDKSYLYFLAALRAKLDDEFEGNVTNLAKEVDLSRVYVSNICNGIKPAGYKSQKQIAQALGFELDQFLAFGRQLENNEEPNDVPIMDDNFVFVTKVEAKLSAGFGSWENQSYNEELYAFRRDWLYGRGSPDNMVLMDVIGDSMSPYVLDGDTVMIDKSKTELMPNKIYAVRVEDLIYLKYIDREPGKFVLRSHNPIYDPIVIETEFLTENSFQILGCIIWWCHQEFM